MTALCLADCRRRDRHNTDCADDHCHGCQPWNAADGLNLCSRHLERLQTDPPRAAELYAELALVLAATDTPGERVHTSRQPGLSLSDDAVDTRRDIRHILTSWTLLIAEERGLHLPANRPAALGKFVAQHAEWLAALDIAGNASNEFANLVKQGHRYAYPSGTRKFVLPVLCPECGGKLSALLRTTDTLLPHEIVCAGDPDHIWTADQWRDLRHRVERQTA